MHPGCLEVDRVGKRERGVLREHGRFRDLGDLVGGLLGDPGIDDLGGGAAIRKIECFQARGVIPRERIQKRLSIFAVPVCPERICHF